MAEKNKSFNKKWLIVLAVLVLIGVIATTTILLWPKNLQNIVSDSYYQETEFFLNSDEDSNLYSEFQTKLTSVETNYKKESDSVKKVNDGTKKILHFYNNYLLYADQNSVFKNNYSNIIDNLSLADNAQNKMSNLLKRVHDKLDVDSTNTTRTAWREFRQYYVLYLRAYTKVFSSYEEIFNKCLPEGAVKNLLTINALTAANEYLKVILKDFNDMVVTEQGDMYTPSVTFKGNKKVDKFENFISVYFTDNAKFVNYQFNSSSQNLMKQADKFKEVYNDSYFELISSINDVGYSYSAIDADQGGLILTAAIKLLNGEV